MPAHLILLDFITRTILGKKYRSLSSSLCSFLHSPVTSSLLDPNTLLNTLFSNTLSLRSSLNVSRLSSYFFQNKQFKKYQVHGTFLVAIRLEKREKYLVQDVSTVSGLEHHKSETPFCTYIFLTFRHRASSI